jgi:outer membrane protein TolC
MNLRQQAIFAALMVSTINVCSAENVASIEPLQTTEAEAASNNPIRLTISKDVLTGDLPPLNRPLGLEDAVKLALRDNPSLEQSQRSWTISKFMSRSVLGRLGPQASFNTFFSESSLNQTLFFMNDSPVAAWPMQNTAAKGTLFSAIFSARQPLFTGGRLIGGYKAARAQERQVLARYNSDRVGVALKVRQTYWEAAWNKAKLLLATDYVKYRQTSVAYVKAKADTGKLPRADLLREEAELARARAQLNEIYRDYNGSLIKLKALLAINFVSDIDLTDSLEYSETPFDLNHYLSEAARKRPEINAAHEFVLEMKARRKVAMSKYSPQIDLYGVGSNQTGRTPESIGSNVDGRWGGLVSVIGGVTLFDSGSRLNELRAANEAVRKAEAAVKEAEIKIGQEVSLAWIDLDLMRKNVELSEAQVISGNEDQRLLHARFMIGKATSLEDFIAAVKKLEAQVNKLEAIYKYRLAQTQLLAASGNE